MSLPFPYLGLAQLLRHRPSVRVIENLSGHSINRYQIHGGKSVLLVKNDDPTKMEEGEYYAIETFGSTGRGRVVESVSALHGRYSWNCAHIDA